MVLEEQYCYKQMQKGCAFQKLRGHKKFSRVYKLSTNLCSITWYPTRTRGSKLLIADIKRVKRGVNPNRNNIFPSSAISYSLTIFLSNQTIELLATTNDSADIWLVGLRYLVYRATSHEHTVRGMWLSEEFHRLIESSAGERVTTTTPTNSTGRMSPEQLPASPLHRASVEVSTRSPSFGNEYAASAIGVSNNAAVYGEMTSTTQHLTVSLQKCITRIKELSYYCAQFSLASLSARDNRNITEREFIEMYEFYSSMDPVLSFIFQFNSNGDDYLTCEELGAFLRVEFPYLSQVDEVYLATVVEHYEPIPILRTENCLGIDGLITYLLSPDLSVMNPFHTQVNQDMSHPITHYFINASHNSFLTGDQLYSQSSEEMVGKLLLDGVRHVELDLWDGPDGEPECYHAYTSTSKVKVIQVLQIIRDTAFASSLFPVLLDLENHCSIVQQIKIAHYLRDVFKEALFVNRPGDGEVALDLATVPLINLRGKIFVKSKRIPSMDNQYEVPASPPGANYGEVSDENSADELPSHCKTFANTPSGNPDVVTTHSAAASDGGTGTDNYEMLPMYEQRRKQHILLGRKPTLALSRYLSALVTIKSKLIDMEQLQLDPSQREPNVLHQINERDAVLQVRQKFLDISLFCESNLVKLSPSSSRVNSSNPDPVQFWNAGIQIVALNQQKQQQNDKAIRFNKALFKSNGNCGYFLKPIYSAMGSQECLELEVMFFFVSRIQAFIQSQVAAMPSHRWTLQVEIKGHMNDTSTRYIDCMNLPPTPEKFTINYPSMAFFCLTLYEELSKSRKFSSDFVIPVASIAAGFKVVPLLGPSSCVVIVDINANTKPPGKEKRRKSFLKIGRKPKLSELKDHQNRQSFEIYQSQSFRFSRRNNVSTPNLATAGPVSPSAYSHPNGYIVRNGQIPPREISPDEFSCGYEAHCATVGVPNSSGQQGLSELQMTAEQRWNLNTSSLRTRNRSSIHELAMSSIANLFKENTNHTSIRNQVLLGKSALLSSEYASHYQTPVLNLSTNNPPQDPQNVEELQATRLSSDELRANVFDENTVPIYDSPLEDQVSQSCHNSPLHQESSEDYQRSRSAKDNSMFVAHTEASAFIPSEKAVNRSEVQEVAPFEIAQRKPQPLERQASHDPGPSQGFRPVNRVERPSPAPRLPGKGSKMPARSVRYGNRATGSGYKGAPKSFIRGRASSLSDNDQFSSDEELDDGQFMSSAQKFDQKLPTERSSFLSGEDSLDLEDNLNLSNLAAEIEEEFGNMNINAYDYSDDDYLKQNFQESEPTSVDNFQNIKSQSSLDFDHGRANTDSYLGADESEGYAPDLEEGPRGASAVVKPRARAFTRQTSGYESGLESPTAEVASREEKNEVSDEDETNASQGNQYFYQTTMV